MIYVDDRQTKINVDKELIDQLTYVIEFALKEEEVSVKFHYYL